MLHMTMAGMFLIMGALAFCHGHLTTRDRIPAFSCLPPPKTAMATVTAMATSIQQVGRGGCMPIPVTSRKHSGDSLLRCRLEIRSEFLWTSDLLRMIVSI